MTLHHHPSGETLLRFASGSLSPGLRIVVSAHMETCPSCRCRGADLEAVGGRMLSDLRPAPMSEGAMAAALLALDHERTFAKPAPPIAEPAALEGIVLPSALRSCKIGQWRRVAPGVRLSSVRLASDESAKVVLLRVRKGRHMPQHGHIGFEFTQVLSGSFSDGGNRYLPGDFVEGDCDTDHSPVIGPEAECVSLAAIDGQIRFRGLLGRLLQPFVGI